MLAELRPATSWPAAACFRTGAILSGLSVMRRARFTRADCAVGMMPRVLEGSTLGGLPGSAALLPRLCATRAPSRLRRRGGALDCPSSCEDCEDGCNDDVLVLLLVDLNLVR